jgi:hypothetical protein
MIDLTPLRTLADPNITGLPCYHGGGEVIVGYLGTLRFIVSVEPDGHCEASLARGKRPATDAQVTAFFRKWGIPVPKMEDTRARHCRMFVVQDTRPAFNN